MNGRGPGGNAVSVEEATASLSGLEDKILNQYNFAKVNLTFVNWSFNFLYVHICTRHASTSSLAGRVRCSP